MAEGSAQWGAHRQRGGFRSRHQNRRLHRKWARLRSATPRARGPSRSRLSSRRRRSGGPATAIGGTR
eukprot:9629790-Lingulodinium_polyedra.AAC.1